MRVSGQFEIGTQREKVFELVNDAKLLAGCIPGCSDMEEIGPNRYSAILQVEVAFLKPKFQVEVQLSEVHEPDLLRAHIHGKPVGLPGQLTATAELTLQEVGAKACIIHYILDQTLTGKFGGIGQSVFRAKSEEQGQIFAANLKRIVQERVMGVNS